MGHQDPKYHGLFATLEDRKSVVAWNKHEHSAPSQAGGMAMMVTGLVSNYAKPNSEVEDSGKKTNRSWKMVLTACGRYMRSSSAGDVLPTSWTNKSGGLREPEDVTKVSLSAWAQQKRYYKAR